MVRASNKVNAKPPNNAMEPPLLRFAKHPERAAGIFDRSRPAEGLALARY